MENKKYSFNDLNTFKTILTDKNGSFLDKLKDYITGDKKKIIKDFIENKLGFETLALKEAVKEITTLQNTKTTEQIISKISDITSSENYFENHSDFITFIKEEGKQYYVIGDLHDDMKTFDQILKGINYEHHFDKINLVFLGDYVDRGKDRLTLMNKIIFLKYLLPDNIHLLRGNHELYRVDEKGDYHSPMLGATPGGYHFDLLTFLINSDNEQNKALVKKNGIDKELIELYAQFFDSMPTAALFNFKEIKICAIHGGLPRPNLNTQGYFDANEYESFNALLDDGAVDSVGIKQKTNMIWSDPYDGYEEGFRNTSEVRFSFSEDQFNQFCEKFDIDLFLRAHEAQENGYKTYFGNRLVSVFSSGGRNKQTRDIVNDNSYYENVSPNFLIIDDNQINSQNINFETDEIISNEESFQYEAIKANRAACQDKPIEKKDIKSVDIKSLVSNPDVIQIIDIYNPINKKLFISKGAKLRFGYTELSQFYGINKDVRFEIDQHGKTIKNLGNIDINIESSEAPLKRDAVVSIDVKTEFFIQDGFRLVVVI